MKKYLHKLAIIFSILMMLVICRAISALNLYESPDSKSKPVATITKGQPLIPIYFQGEWVKVADPSNGNVGWVNKTDLTNEGYPTFQVKTFGKQTKNEKVQGYQIIQYASDSQSIDQKQITTLMQNLQVQESTIQKQMNQMFQQAFGNLHEAWSQPTLVPVLQPIILVPEK